jgi:hypothetical protein
MKLLKASLSVLAAAFMVAPPSAALAEAVVPPGNPAAIQYTEAFPTSRGPTDAEHADRHDRSPDQALGGRNAKRLETQGTDGRETARVAAETAPQTGGAQATGGGSGSGANPAPKSGDGGNGNGISQGGGGGEVETPPQASAADEGSSGLGNVAGQATGLDASEGTGLLLPLAILGTLAWGGAYVLRRRKRAAQ